MFEQRWCVVCGVDTAWEAPECPDGHGEDCPEQFCQRCGVAVWAGVLDQRARPAS
jgi:hypothetical protein